MSKKATSSLMMVLTAMIWGLAFIAQSQGMDYVGPFTFNAVRNLLAGIALLPVLRFMHAGKPQDAAVRRLSIRSGLLCGLILFAGSTLQQFGILYTSVAKTSFITTLYIVIVPLLGLFLGKRVAGRIWAAVALALVGLYLLCIPMGGESLSVNVGDMLVLLCALMFSFHILAIDRFTGSIDGVLTSCVQFFVVSALSAVCMLLFESPTLPSIAACWMPLLYTSVMSSAVGYTMQILAQKHVSPAVSSLILSLESVFGALFGFLLLGETCTAREFSGMALMFAATILAQLPARQKKSV